MDILDIEVSSEEIHQFEQNEKLFGRKLWEEYNKCEVEGCQLFGSFTTYRQYINHWRNLHERFVKLFKCTGCGKRFTNEKTAKIHVRSHKLAVLEIMDQENKYFKDPGTCLPYLFDSSHERLNTCIREEDKVAAHRKRKTHDQNQDVLLLLPLKEENRMDSKNGFPIKNSKEHVNDEKKDENMKMCVPKFFFQY